MASRYEIRNSGGIWEIYVASKRISGHLSLQEAIEAAKSRAAAEGGAEVVWTGPDQKGSAQTSALGWFSPIARAARAGKVTSRHRDRSSGAEAQPAP